MENKFSFADYKGFSEEELKKLPLNDLAKLNYHLLQEYFKLNQQMHQNSTNSSRAPSSDSPEATEWR